MKEEKSLEKLGFKIPGSYVADRGGVGACSASNRSVREVYDGSRLALREIEPIMHRPVRVLIAGAGSYIGTCVGQYLSGNGDYMVHTLDMHNISPKPHMFRSYDAVLFVAGIAHRKETARNAHLYYEVNRDLAVKTAEAAKAAHVPHFILLSSMAVYGMENGHITKDTKPGPKGSYGKSKLQADEAVWHLRDDRFRAAILRPPMVYGKGCRGNYQLLRKLVLAVPVFPAPGNERSMVYIGNLCAFIKEAIDGKREGIFFPQNGQYVDTGVLARRIAEANGRRIRETAFFNSAIGRSGLKIIRKMFGSLTYEKADAIHNYSFRESIEKTEKNTVDAEVPDLAKMDGFLQINDAGQKRILVLSTREYSYVGKSFMRFMKKWPDAFQADFLCRKDGLWKVSDFTGYHAVLYTDGADWQQGKREKQQFYKTGTCCAAEAASMAKKAGAGLFLYLSSLRVYGREAGVITKETFACPSDAYGKEALDAEKELWRQRDEGFLVAILRLPVVYGYKCGSQYQAALKFAVRHGCFPEFGRKRSVLHIENLSSVIRNIIRSGQSGVFFPQDASYASTYEMAREAVGFHGGKIRGTKLWNPVLWILASRLQAVQEIFWGYVCDQSLNVPGEWLEVKNIKEGIQQAESGWWMT